MSTLTPAAAAFDRLSIRYEQLCDNDIFLWMRAQVRGAWMARIAPGSRVLEVGCGAGLDTAFLAAQGVDVTATDPAPGMLKEASGRVSVTAGAGSARLLLAGLENVDDALDRAGVTAPFGAIVSNFGALNCAQDLAPLTALAQRRLVPGGAVLVCLMARVCPWEVLYFLGRFQPRQAFRRLAAAPVMVEVEGIPVPTYYHRPADVMRALGPDFTLRRLTGLAILVPPPWLAHGWARVPARVRRAVSRLDSRIGSLVGVRHLGDHFLMDIVKR